MAKGIYIRIESIKDWISVVEKLLSQGRRWEEGDTLSHEEYWLNYKEDTVLVVDGLEKAKELAYMSFEYFCNNYDDRTLVTSEEFLDKNKVEKLIIHTPTYKEFNIVVDKLVSLGYRDAFFSRKDTYNKYKSDTCVSIDDNFGIGFSDLHWYQQEVINGSYKGYKKIIGVSEFMGDDMFLTATEILNGMTPTFGQSATERINNFFVNPESFYWDEDEYQKTLKLKDLKVGGIYKIASGSEKKCGEFVNLRGKYIRITYICKRSKNFSYDILNEDEEQISECLACFKPEDLIPVVLHWNKDGLPPWDVSQFVSKEWPDITIFDESGNFNSNNKTMARKLTAKIRRLFSNDERKLYQAGYYDECRSLTSKGRETLQLIMEDKFKEYLMKEAEKDIMEDDKDNDDKEASDE